AKAQKDLGTYYLSETFDEDGNVTGQSGMMQFIQPDDIVHHTINMTSTETTRLSSARPNSQNLPRKGTSKVKQMFTSRFDGGKIVEADYSALEVVGLCGFSKDRALTKALVEGIDMHCMRLAAKLGETYEEVKHKAKDNEDHPDHAR
ncbi:DNA polymerase, partial [Cutibacterium acnes]